MTVNDHILRNVHISLVLLLMYNCRNLVKKFNLRRFSGRLLVNLGIISGDLALLGLNLVRSLSFFVAHIAVVSLWFALSLEVDERLASLSEERVRNLTVLPPEWINTFFLVFDWSIDVQYFLVV
mgnify:CR=1 FL=1